MEQLTLVASAVTSDNEFAIKDDTITVKDDSTGYYFVEYNVTSQTAMKIAVKDNEFPTSGTCTAFCTFRDKCDTDIVYTGAIVAPIAKLDPSTIDKGLGKTEKHSFVVDFTKSYCNINGELFSLYIDK